jgi:phospholipase/carboxylesterase
MKRLPDLTGKSILIATGRFDRIVPAAETRQLIRSLKAAGASVKAVHVDAGHELTQTDVDVAQSWFFSGSERLCTHGPCMSENVA